MIRLLKRLRRAPSIAVSEERGVRMLHVGGEAIQSAMRLDAPHALALDYTRCMMAFLLFHPEPQQALLIGLGGGSLAKYLHRFLRKTRVRVVELDARIVATARAHFALPADDARLRVEIGDGVEALSPACCDVLMVDAYEDERHVEELASADFYDAAYLALEEQGALVVNYMDDDKQLDRNLQRLERAFGGAVLCIPALYDDNVIAIALKGTPPRVAWDSLLCRGERLESRYGLPFTRYVGALRKMNRHDAAELVIIPND